MIITPRSSFNRPANTTAYADGDLVSNTTTGAEFAPLTFNISRLMGSGAAIKAIRFYKDASTTSNADFVLNLFTQDPGIAIADNAALSFADYRYFLAAVDCDLSSGGDAGSGGNLFERFDLSNPILTDPKTYAAGQPLIYGILEADAAYSPASGELFEITLEISDSI